MTTRENVFFFVALLLMFALGDARRDAQTAATALVQAHIHELQHTAWIEYRARMLELERTALGDCFCGPDAGFCDQGRGRW